MNIASVMQKRDEIARKYCKEKGWDFDNLTIEQILEIRKLPEWQNATKTDD